MTRALTVGISTCPNDTFAFAGLLTGAVEAPGLELRFELADVEELNRRALAGELDVAKVSFAAALSLADDVTVLPSGAALGRGVGPLLLGAAGRTRPADAVDGRPPRVLCPGRSTTASLLYELFHPGRGRVEQVVFSAILPALEAGEADFGVCIHEGRFTWRDRGLVLVEDLGETWEQATGAELPLGGIVARASLGDDVARALSDALARSIAWGHAHRDAAAAVMRRHAQELSDDVLWAHVELYVNERTRDLGEEGRRALAELARRARSVRGDGASGELRVL